MTFKITVAVTWPHFVGSRQKEMIHPARTAVKCELSMQIPANPLITLNYFATSDINHMPPPECTGKIDGSSIIHRHLVKFLNKALCSTCYYFPHPHRSINSCVVPTGRQSDSYLSPNGVWCAWWCNMCCRSLFKALSCNSKKPTAAFAVGGPFLIPSLIP